MHLFIRNINICGKLSDMRRRFSADGVIHIYQRTVSGFNLFYSLEDFLVFYTIVSVQASVHGISLLGLCMMIDHVHILLAAENLKDMSRFMSACSSLYVREFNRHVGRKGRLFESSYGSAVKLEMKKIRSAIAYLFNNPVEKKLCLKAEEYRWNFLAYYRSGSRFSMPSSCSRRMKRAMRLVDDSFKNGRYLKYALLKAIFKDLDAVEKQSITDYIISVYFPFEIERTVGCYNSFDEMLVAINSNTGSEYDINEHHYGKTDVPYREIMACLKKMGVSDAKSLITLPESTKMQYLSILKKSTSASYRQIRKFLHLEDV